MPARTNGGGRSGKRLRATCGRARALAIQMVAGAEGACEISGSRASARDRKKRYPLAAIFFRPFFTSPYTVHERPKSHDFTTFSAPYPMRVPAVITSSGNVYQ